MIETPKIGTWATRFGWAMMAHAAVFMLVTALIAVPPALTALGVKSFEPSVGKIIAGGSAGTWFVMGYIFYFLVGVVAVGMFGMGYYVYENILGLRLEGKWKKLAWTNFVMLNAGVAASAYILMYAGYFGGAMVMAKASLPAEPRGGGQATLHAIASRAARNRSASLNGLASQRQPLSSRKRSASVPATSPVTKIMRCASAGIVAATRR